jgi:hypothetical protein
MIDTNTSSGITTWRDKSGGGRHFTQSTASAAPSNALGQINGRAVVRFDGTTDFIRDDAAAPDVSAGNNTTMFFFLQTGPNGGGPEGFFDSAPNSQYTLRNQPRNVWEYWPGYNLNLDLGANQKVILTFQTEKVSGSSVSVYSRGWKNMASLGTVVQNSDVTVAWNRPTLGAWNLSPRYDGDIGDVLIYSRVFGTNEMQRVGFYLERKWGVAADFRMVDHGAGAVKQTGGGGATLNGFLSDSNAVVTVYWGRTDGGTTASAWSNAIPLGALSMGAFSTNLSVSSSSPLWYRLYATNAATSEGDWSIASERFDVTPTLTVSNASVAEGQSGTVLLRFPAVLDAASSDPVTVQYATTPFEAVSPGDYQAVTGTLTIPPGVSVTSIPVVVQGDTLSEGNLERFYLTLSNVSNATLATSVALGTILDDDPVTAPDLPTNHPSLVLWLEAGTLVTNSAGLVTGWTDRSGGGRDFVQSTPANMPTSIVNSVRGRPGVRFGPDNNTYLRNSGASQLTAALVGPTSTHFFVVAPVATSVAGIYDSAPNAAKTLRNLSGQWDWHNQEPAVNFACTGGRLANILTVATDSTGANRILSVWRDGTLIGCATSAVAPEVAYNSAVLGNINLGGTGLYNGDIDEVIFYRRILTSNEFQRVGVYLATKYGLATAFALPPSTTSAGVMMLIR